MIAQHLTNNNFVNEYMEFYAMRQAFANLQLEDNKTNALDPLRSKEMIRNRQAFKTILDHKPERITPYDLIEIAYAVNGDLYNKGFRKTNVDVPKAKNFIPLSPSNIPEAIYSVFNSYHNIWNILNVYEKEARLHIELVRIQAFEDGNKRTARILTSYNLLMQNKAPIIINGEDTEEYFKYIDDYDIEGMAKFFKFKSEEEFNIMLELYENICGGSFDKEEVDSEGVKIYKKKKYIV